MTETHTTIDTDYLAALEKANAELSRRASFWRAEAIGRGAGPLAYKNWLKRAGEEEAEIEE